jgi:hypothetical protein
LKEKEEGKYEKKLWDERAPDPTASGNRKEEEEKLEKA